MKKKEEWHKHNDFRQWNIFDHACRAIGFWGGDTTSETFHLGQPRSQHYNKHVLHIQEGRDEDQVCLLSFCR